MSKYPYHSITNKEKRDEKHEGNQSIQSAEQNAVQSTEQRYEGEGAERLQKLGKNERKELFGFEGMQVKKDKARGGKAKAMRSPFDVNGSYTGTAADGEKPVQDADDL